MAPDQIHECVQRVHSFHLLSIANVFVMFRIARMYAQHQNDSGHDGDGGGGKIVGHRQTAHLNNLRFYGILYFLADPARLFCIQLGKTGDQGGNWKFRINEN